MRPLARTLIRIAAPVAAVALTASLVPAPSSAATTTTLDPRKLDRGADVAVAHLEDRTIVDGALRIPVKAPTVRLLGRSGTAYVVGTANERGGGGRVLRVAADGTSTKLGRANIYLTELAGDGLTVVSARYPRGRKSQVTVRSATTGVVVAERRFRGYVTVLDAQADQVLLGADGKTRLWSTTTDSVGEVTRMTGYLGDLSTDVLAAFTKDPYLGGCTRVIRISTGQQLWKSCLERVTSLGPDAARMATINILSDGIGPSYVVVRRSTGEQLGAYQVKHGWFGELSFESPTALLLETHGRRRTATVRCGDDGCERASGLSRTVHPRLG